jgi:hypothetical protein
MHGPLNDKNLPEFLPKNFAGCVWKTRSCLTRPDALQGYHLRHSPDPGTTEQLQTVSHPGITIHTHRVTDKKTKGRVTHSRLISNR